MYNRTETTQNDTLLEVPMNINNRLFATFFPKEDVDSFIENLTTKYTILYNKVFVLEIEDSDEFICTYNLDQQNLGTILDNTILVHRKKQTNSLYTVNALNEIIKNENDGNLDKNFMVNWENYKNSLLCTQSGELRHLNTRLHKIITI